MPRWFRVALDLALPRRCEACAGSLVTGQVCCLCDVCRAGMLPLPAPYCTCCAVPLQPDHRGPACLACICSPPRFTTARAAGLYLPVALGLNPLATAVHRLKYERRRQLAAPLGGLLAERFPFGEDVLLVPVPLHVTRLRTRGFNQAVLLARSLARHRGLETALRALARTRATSPQARLPAAARRANLRGAFVVGRPSLVAGRHVVLIDDVLTTGATANACAEALLDAGVPRVDVYTVGRAP